MTVSLGLTRRRRLRRRVSSTLTAAVVYVRDPGLRAVLVLFAIAITGFVMFALSWRGVARTIYVPLQLPWLISGGLVGISLIGAALGALSIHLGRRDAAAYRATMDDVVRTAVELSDGIRTERIPLPK